ncbi:dihydropteroate synthase [Pelobacter sp. M08fum]|uniref:Dihydropteroate synthase n=2 Tax=Pelovirga terrestris TaxID=2771352 RepID=A0A8J6UHS9_9BACT|nr:dihydropteroate synthase [Pelovirga terrestris]MBD1399780.1 dihydropteroate synthase [Pelovirga terrestris]
MMAILNVTPDSFSDGGDYIEISAAIERGLEMAEQGAAILDVGGESTRPGAPVVSAEVELERVIPVIEGLRRHTSIPLSIDTHKATVAGAALAAGANFVNDISGLSFDSRMAAVAAAAGAGLFLMHTRGTPQQMQKDTDYQDLLIEVLQYLQGSISRARSAGISTERLAVDPGIGFAKNVAGNLLLLKHLTALHQLGCPILLGTSRKSFIGKILHQDDPRRRLYGTLATIALGVAQGVQLFRVHDVRPACEAALVAWAIREQQFPLLP